jgi:hypothetical protein
MITFVWACSRPVPPAAPITVAAPEGAFVLQWTEFQHFGLGEPRVVMAEERWTPTVDAPPDGRPGVVWSVLNTRGDELARPTRMWTAPDGVHRLVNGGARMELPSPVAPGDAWGEPGRSCVAEATPFCPEGVATVCTTEVGTRYIWLRQHWCAVGWVGFEAVSTQEDQPTQRFWSEHVTRDGAPMPSAPLSERSVPEP